MSFVQQILRSKGIKILAGLFFVVSLSFAAQDKASAGSSDTKIAKPDYPKFNDNTGSNSFNKPPNKISTSSVDNPVSPIPKTDYPKYKQPELPDLNKSIPKPEYIKFKHPELPSLNKNIPKPGYIDGKIPTFGSGSPVSSIPKPDYIKFKQPDLPNLNKDLKIAQPDHTLHYFNMGLHYEKAGRIKDAIESYKKFITFSPPNKNTPYVDYAKQKVTELEKIDSGFGKRR